MKLRTQKHIAISLGLITAFTIGCGGDDGTKVAANNSDNNASTNNTATNNTATNNTATNNTNPNNTNPNNTNPNNTNPNNTSTNNTNPNNAMGSLTFASPTEDTVYTNGVLALEIAPVGDAQDVELVLNEEEVLNEFAGETTFDWDTASRVEGEYELSLRFTLGDGGARWSDDVKTVVVDRTSPLLTGSLPLDGSTTNRPNAPITASFDEPLDPASVDPTTVSLTFDNGQTTAYTVGLSADGQTIALQFDRTSVQAPYTATVSVTGVTDLAGNLTRATYSYSVPAWIAESIPAPMADMEYVTLGGSEYLIGTVQGSPNDILRIYKKAGTWMEIVSEPMSNIYDIAVDTAGDRAHIAVLHRTSSGGLILKEAKLVEFNPNTDSITLGGSQVVGVDSNNGAIALEVRAAGIGTVDAIATVSDGVLRVYEFTNRGLTTTTQNTFPTANYSNVRDEDLAINVKAADGMPEVIFARCSGVAVPCVRTYAERLVKTGSGWNEIGGASTTFTSGVSNLCDEYSNFEAVFINDLPTMLFSYYGPCDAPTPELRWLAGSGSGWDNQALGVLDTMPNADTDRYTSHIAVNAADEVLALMASDSRLIITQLGANGPEWMAPIGESLPTNVQKFSEARLFMDANDAPVAVFRHGTSTHVWRSN